VGRVSAHEKSRRTVPSSPAKRSVDGSKTVLEVKKENSLGRQGSNPRGKGVAAPKDEFDDKEFEKRYEGKLGKSTDGTKSQDGTKAKQLATPSAASQKAVKSGAPSIQREKSGDKFEKALTKSDINKINTQGQQQQQHTSSIRESIHDSYSGF
jgi:hypothetical protein